MSRSEDVLRTDRLSQTDRVKLSLVGRRPKTLSPDFGQSGVRPCCMQIDQGRVFSVIHSCTPDMWKCEIRVHSVLRKILAHCIPILSMLSQPASQLCLYRLYPHKMWHLQCLSRVPSSRLPRGERKVKCMLL